jgi:hypothetical protein
MPRGDWIKNCVCVILWSSSAHMTKHKILKVFLLPYTSAMVQNAAKISYTNFRVTKTGVDKNIACLSSLISLSEPL